MLVVFLQTLLKILHREMTSFEAGPTPQIVASRPPREQGLKNRPGMPLTVVIASPSKRYLRSGIIRQFVRPQ